MNFIATRRVKGQAIERQSENAETQCPYINFASRIVLGLLGGFEAFRSEEFVGAVVVQEGVFFFVEDLCGAKVSNFDVIVRIQQDVLRLKVEMNNLLIVQISKGRNQLL